MDTTVVLCSSSSNPIGYSVLFHCYGLQTRLLVAFALGILTVKFAFGMLIQTIIR